MFEKLVSVISRALVPLIVLVVFVLARRFMSAPAESPVKGVSPGDLTARFKSTQWTFGMSMAMVALIFALSTHAVLILISLTLSAVVAGFGLLWIARRYRRMQLSDQTFLFDALWLSVSLWVSVYLMGNHAPFCYLLGLLPFVLYKISVGFGLKRLARRAEDSGSCVGR